MNQTPTAEEHANFSLRAFKGIDAGLGQADPGAAIARKLDERHPGHLILVQAGKFLHGYDRTAYALSTLKKYRLKLVGTSADPHLRVGFPAGNFKRRLWPLLADFGIPYAVALGTQAVGHTVYVSDQPSGNADVLASVSPQILQEVIAELRQRGELNIDHWVKQGLRARHYLRYVDDMVFLGDRREALQQIGAAAVARLAEEGLTVHPRKVRLARVAAGIPWLGYVVWPHHVSAGRYIRSRYARRLREHDTQGVDRHEALESYRAMLAHTGATR